MAIDFTSSPEKRVDWEAAKICLAELQREAPGILKQAVIIGGIACWFYRNLLAKGNDPEFKVPAFSPAEESYWLSKDIDFTNYFAEDARNLLQRHIVVDQTGRRLLQVAGVPIGFAQVGLTFDPETAWTESWITTFEAGSIIVQCRVLNPERNWLWPNDGRHSQINCTVRWSQSFCASKFASARKCCCRSSDSKREPQQ